MRRMDGWLLAGLVLLLCGVGCGSALETAIRIENAASVAASTAPETIDRLCHIAMERALTEPTADKANVVIATCSKAEDAYNAFRDAWLVAADAIHMAQLGQKPADFDAIVAAVESAQRDLFAAIDAVRSLAQ